MIIVTDEGTFYDPTEGGNNFQALPDSVTISHGNWLDAGLAAFFWDENDVDKLWTESNGEFQEVEANLGQDAGINNVNDVLTLGGRTYIATDQWVVYQEEGDSTWYPAASDDLTEGELPPVNFLMGHELPDKESDDYEVIGVNESWGRYHIRWSESAN